LTEAGVSRRHLELAPVDEGLLITDLGSVNGTFQGAQRIQSITVVGPTRLRLGPVTELEIVPDPPLATEPYPCDRFGDALGGSPAMRQLFGLLARVAPTDSTVLLQGETGTGKEKLAEAVHAASRRRGGPFVVVDCGAIPPDLIGSELFGHSRGAFTGATGGKRGLVEEASGGTLFLDELGELPLAVQPQLLRLLAKHEARRVGETTPYHVDLRIIAATNRDLRAMARRGQFREDLYFRVAVVNVTVPPLRARLEDLPALTAHFLEQLGRPDVQITGELWARFLAHDWPGNVRELRNIVERVAAMDPSALSTAGDDALGPAHADPDAPRDALGGPFKLAKDLLVGSFERGYLTHLLARHHGNLTSAAHEAGIARNYLHRLVKKHNLPTGRETNDPDR
jgi:transcriptional regulator with PAS, ATPase and Fis domain